MSHVPTEVPSTARLLKATVLALLAATFLLVMFVLPAEYGIDPTGVGARLGLDALATTREEEAPADPVEVAPGKPVAAAEDDPAAATGAEPELDAVGQPVKPVDASVFGGRDGAYRNDTLSVTLAPGKGAEIKAAMKSGASFVFLWSASAEVAFDMHGERTGAADGEYTSYWIEPSRKQTSGSFTAPFDGSHGWYWLNRGSSPVTVRVEVAGFQERLFRPGEK